MEELKEYIQDWNKIEGVKPRNEKVFIDNFIKLLNVVDTSDVVFEGDNYYYGRQINLQLNRLSKPDPILHFEIAYSEDCISVYTAEHNDFWQPEYLLLRKEDPRFDEVCKALYELLYKVFRLPSILELQENIATLKTKIDDEFEELINVFEKPLSVYIKKLCPYIPSVEVDRLSKEWGQEIYDKVLDVKNKINEHLKNRKARK